MCVLRPAECSETSRSKPITAPKTTATTRRIRIVGSGQKVSAMPSALRMSSIASPFAWPNSLRLEYAGPGAQHPPRPASLAGEPVAAIAQWAGLERQTAAADAAGELVAQACQQ